MSEVAGRMSIQEGAKFLERPQEGRGILLAGVPGVAPAEVAILGGGIVGSNAAKLAAGLGANVRILDVNLDRLRYLDDIMPPNVDDTLLRPAHHPGVGRAGRPRHRRDPDHRGPRPSPRPPGRPRADEVGRGDRRRGDRPGRVHRDQPPDHAPRADLRSRRRGPLLRHQHAGRGGPDIDVCPEQRDLALRAPTGPGRLARDGRRRRPDSPRGSTSTAGG